MYINITTITIIVTLFNNHMESHFLENGFYYLDVDKAYGLPPAIIYTDVIHSYYHPVDHYLVSVLDITCPTTMQIDDKTTEHFQSELSIKKMKKGYHQVFVYEEYCEPTLERWIYNETEHIQIREYK